MKPDNEDDDYEYDRIGPYNGHTQWEPGVGCFIFILMAILLLVVSISIGAGK